MRTILIIVMAVIFIQPCIAQEDAISRFFSEYEGRDDFTTVYITSKMFSLIAQIPEEENEEEMMSIIRKLTGLKILISDEYEESERLYQEAYRILPKNGYEDLMIVTEGDEEIRFLVREANNKISEFIMLIGGGEENNFFLMSMVGDLRLEDISKLSKTMDIDGFDHLDKVKDKQ